MHTRAGTRTRDHAHTSVNAYTYIIFDIHTRTHKLTHKHTFNYTLHLPAADA